MACQEAGSQSRALLGELQRLARAEAKYGEPHVLDENGPASGTVLRCRGHHAGYDRDLHGVLNLLEGLDG